MDKITNNILLLGNGFDLSIGLESKFSDYVSFVFKDKGIELSNIIDCCTNATNKIERLINIFSYLHSNRVDLYQFIIDNWLILLSFFMVDNKIFCKFKQLNWANIEQNLTKYVCSELFGNDIPVNCYYYWINEFNPHGMTKYPTNIKIKKEKIVEYINKFTDSFVYYLKNQIENDEIKSNKENSDSLKSKAWKKLSNILNIISPENNWRNYLKVKTYILNFNYTKWFESYKDEHNLYIINFETNNIHGRIDDIHSKCIIGIDDKKVNFSQEDKELTNEYVFSKTYKRLTSNLQNSLPLPVSDGITNIIFCGLSLSMNDDVYYDTIFNTYDIYNNKKVKLYFFFLDGYDCYSEMYRLLKKYGENFENDLQGNTLITKLSIEGRLKIIKIP